MTTGQVPLNPHKPWQAGFWCRDQIIFWDSVCYKNVGGWDEVEWVEMMSSLVWSYKDVRRSVGMKWWDRHCTVQPEVGYFLQPPHPSTSLFSPSKWLNWRGLTLGPGWWRRGWAWPRAPSWPPAWPPPPRDDAWSTGRPWGWPPHEPGQHPPLTMHIWVKILLYIFQWHR